MFTAMVVLVSMMMAIMVLTVFGLAGCFRHRPKLDATLAIVCQGGILVMWVGLGGTVLWWAIIHL